MATSTRQAYDSPSARALLRLARTEFSSSLSQAEVRVLQQSAMPGDFPAPTAPGITAKSAAGHTVRGALLRWLVASRPAMELIDANGIRLQLCELTGKVDLEDRVVKVPLRFHVCLFRDQLSVSNASLRHLDVLGCELRGGIDASGLHCETDIHFTDNFLPADKGRKLSARFDRSSVGGEAMFEDMRCELPFTAIRMQVAGSLSFDRSHLDYNDWALRLEGARVGSQFFARNLKLAGAVDLIYFQAMQNIEASGIQSTYQSDNDPAVNAEHLSVSGNFNLLNSHFSSGLTFDYAHIGADFNLTGTEIKAGDLSIETAHIDGDLILNRFTAARSDVTINESHIGLNVSCIGAQFDEFFLINSTVNNDLYWLGVRVSASKRIDFSDTSVRTLYDDRGSWPKPETLLIQGFTYTDLIPTQKPSRQEIDNADTPLPLKLSAADRIPWLELQDSGYLTVPQPWQQLSKVLDAHGDSAGAKHVLYHMRRRQKTAQGRLASALSWPHDMVEEDSLRILAPICTFWLLGTIVFWRARRMKAMAPTEKSSYALFAAGQPTPGYPKFSPAVYALENVLPVIKLGQDSTWAPDSAFEPPDTRRRFLRLLPRMDYRWLMRLRWLMIVLGWASAIVLAGAIGSRFK